MTGPFLLSGRVSSAVRRQIVHSIMQWMKQSVGFHP
ncbi:MAG: hypothetical protein ACI92Z_001905, partial [Paracoccaceae bacterium]